MDSSQVTRSPKSSCDTGTPIQSPAKPSMTSLQRSPSKTPISAEMRARIEENRRRAQEIKAKKQQMARIQERADQEADRRAAGEKYLREFGLGSSSSKQKLDFSSTNSNLHRHPEKSNNSFELDCNFLPNHKPPPQPYSPDPRCSAEQLKVLDLVCDFTLFTTEKKICFSPHFSVHEILNSLCIITRLNLGTMYFLLDQLE
ncbi:hypothetical protein PGTUg99_050032 [Puccinia graminis f. sp. tritici]|uniref:Uncharacterized protein n=1 Tax=Puccinia graminis f. sp. tritici TaxID=56615 RepID=A0A5B0P331_PUCGR|nr:hypothetical protein PGTUg99_050032 [Puccinia graminis f. sp. tritici]